MVFLFGCISAVSTSCVIMNYKCVIGTGHRTDSSILRA